MLLLVRAYTDHYTTIIFTFAVCDDAPLYIAKCSNYTIAMQKGSNTKWHCTFIAPVGLEIAVFQNKKSLKVEHSDLDGKESLDSFCTCKEPTVIYDVEEVEEVCYSKYTVNVIVCAVSEEVVGNYSVWGQEKEVEQSSVFVKIPSTALAHSSGNMILKKCIIPSLYTFFVSQVKRGHTFHLLLMLFPSWC